MERKKIAISGPIAIAGITLILVIKLSIHCQPAGNNVFFSGVKQPVSLLVASPTAKKAFDIKGDEIPIDKLLQETPDLAQLL